MEEIVCITDVPGSPICPFAQWHQQMHPETSRFHAGYDSTTGLRYFRCPVCRHTGMVAAGGVQLVFRLAHQYVLTYDPFLSTITVVLPPALIAMGQTYGLADEEVAKHAADWALLSGNNSETLTLLPERQEFFDFTSYLSSLTLPTLSNRHIKVAKPEELARAWSVGATSADGANLTPLMAWTDNQT